MIGQTISHYTILSKLGEGGMGVVYEAHDSRLQRPVALKFLPQEQTGDSAAHERLMREARAASALDHPNICTVHEIGRNADGRYFICMAYYGRSTLKDIIRRGPIDMGLAVGIALQAARGLQKAHETGIVHRDIKPANLAITPDGVVKILDFGLASFAVRTPITRRGTSMGTAAYMSPEQVRGEPVDRRTDIWSLGVCLYEMLTGKLPFRGDYEPALLYSILTDEPEKPPISLQASAPNHGPHQAWEIIRKCLAKRPEDRYATTADLIAGLERLVSGKEQPDAETRPGGMRRPGRRVWLAAVIVILVVCAGAVYLWIRQHPGLPARGRKSIAVLPFRNLGENTGDEYFSDGITEDIISKLSRYGDLTVISRTSVMQYKGTQKTIPQIGKELNVGTILEGSVRRSGGDVRIVGQLIDAGTDTHIWTETYDRRISDVFQVQNDVTTKIVEALKVTLRSDGSSPEPERAVGNITAYEYYLKGREYYYRFSKEDNERAIDLFRDALRLEPEYVAAIAGCADAYAQRVAKFGYPPAWVDSAIALSRSALRLDDRSAEAHKALALAYSGRGWHRLSIAEYTKAVGLNPNYMTAVNNLGVEYYFTGAYDKALEWQLRSVPLNPVYPWMYYTVGGMYGNLDDSAHAMEWFGKCRQLQPDFQYAHAGISAFYLARGNDSAAYREAMQILSGSPADLEALTLAGWAKLFTGDDARATELFEAATAVDTRGTFWYGPARNSFTALGFLRLRSGRRDAAAEILRHSRELDMAQIAQGSEWHPIRYDLAAISALEGKTPEALAWLRKAIDLGWRHYHFGSRDPLMKSLQSTGEFRRMMAEARDSVRQMKERAETETGIEQNFPGIK